MQKLLIYETASQPAAHASPTNVVFYGVTTDNTENTNADIPTPPRHTAAPQRAVWAELDATPYHFTLYGGTALTLRLGHRRSVDFDFFSRIPCDPAALAREIPYLAGAEPVQVVSHTLTCRVERGGPVLVSFFGNLGLGEAAPREIAEGSKVHVASPAQRR